jgi:hypothetical protein
MVDMRVGAADKMRNKRQRTKQYSLVGRRGVNWNDSNDGTMTIWTAQSVKVEQLKPNSNASNFKQPDWPSKTIEQMGGRDWPKLSPI